MKPTSDHRLTHTNENTPNAGERNDAFAEEAVRHMVGGIRPPDGDEAWQRMQGRLRGRSRRARAMRLARLSLAIAVMSLLVSVATFTPDPTYAWRGLVSIVRDAQQGLVQALFGTEAAPETDGAKTAPPPDAGGAPTVPPPDAGHSWQQPTAEEGGVPAMPQLTTLKDAGAIVPFEVRAPRRLPESYAVQRVRAYPDADGVYRTLRVEYRRDAGDGELLTFTQRRMLESGSGWQKTLNNESGKLKHIEIGMAEGVYIAYTSGGSELQWLAVEEGVLYALRGDLTESELLETAASLAAVGE
ncbi:DUF4367 domain-containing protein [Paenibacillus sp. IB182496]|uniref:DUF4367 domain-containing protein n=1 Tax=Paenibacillus sabuli TaxID=2772509 RepID=A0A927BSW9_9BACL|nr:DUF4367 domain-containing protein [Paenibacillus sabuli]MBD2845080.1 DUF4367 domain-containing protein [Paenibacillus sabuli]